MGVAKCIFVALHLMYTKYVFVAREVCKESLGEISRDFKRARMPFGRQQVCNKQTRIHTKTMASYLWAVKNGVLVILIQ